MDGEADGVAAPGSLGTVTYGYDSVNRLTSVTDWNSNATAYAYDDANRMTTTTLPSGTGIVSTNTYDNADRLTAISHVKGGSTTIASVSYTLDSVGNRTQRVDQQGTHSYSYDNLYRLTSVTYPGPATTTYAYDAFGNRTSKVDGGGTTTYAYDNADRITSVTKPGPTTTNYTWDNNGDLTARGSDSFAWDYEDRMTSATVGGTTTTFAYRGDGVRESRTTGGVTTTFNWDVNRGLPVVLGDGTSNFVYGAGLSSMKQGGNWYYYLADGLGSTMAIVDSSGTSQKSYTYDVYGKPTATGALANEFDFGGQQTDTTGLQYLRARYLDPETGTFLSREPLTVEPAWNGNPHGYAAANPARLSDPGGTRPVDENGCGPGNEACYRGVKPSGPLSFGATRCIDWCLTGNVKHLHYDPRTSGWGPLVDSYFWDVERFVSDGRGGVKRETGTCTLNVFAQGNGEYHVDLKCHNEFRFAGWFTSAAKACVEGAIVAITVTPKADPAGAGDPASEVEGVVQLVETAAAGCATGALGSLAFGNLF